MTRLVNHLCPYCGRSDRRSPAGIKENPYCGQCLAERLALHRDPTEKVVKVWHGDYVHFVRVSQK